MRRADSREVEEVWRSDGAYITLTLEFSLNTVIPQKEREIGREGVMERGREGGGGREGGREGERK